MNTAIPTDNFILEDMTYIPVGTHLPVLGRSYVVSDSARAIDIISNRMHEARSGKVTPQILSGVAGDIITPTAVGHETLVNRDWVSTRRFIFMLKVKSFNMMGVEMNSYIQGYTEYDGISNTGNIDPNMPHYINNVIETSVMTINTPLGIVRKEKLFRIYNVFAAQGQEDLYTQRPSDILENIGMMNAMNAMGGASGGMTDAYSVNNFINPFNQNVVSSHADNTVTTEYLSKILTTGILANKSQEIHLGSYEISEQASVESKVPEPAISDNRFLKYLSMVGGFKTAREVFNFGELMKIDNTIFSRFNVFEINKDIVDPVMQATPETGEYWHGQDPVTPKAYSLIENSVGLAIKYGFNKIFFTASNMSNPTGMVEVFITNFKSFIQLDEQDFAFLLEIFKEKFITEIFLNETKGGVEPLHMEGYIDLLGTSKIFLSYLGYPSNWYTIPTFANSLFSPVTTFDKQSLDITSFHINNVINELAKNTNASKGYF